MPDADQPKGVCKQGTKNPVVVSSGDNSQVTVVGCASAAGYCIHLMVIWDRKKLHPDMTKGELPGTLYGLSSKSWIDQELFHVWFESHCLRYAPPVCSLLLLLDGHSSHYCPATICKTAEAQVVLFALPPIATHLSQLFDKRCFGPLRIESVCHEFMSANPGRVVTRYSFSELFS